MPYLPIDPADVGRTYEAIIRVNSQSGKGGVAYLLLDRYGLDLPRGLQVEFAQKVQAITDVQGGELQAEELYAVFGDTLPRRHRARTTSSATATSRAMRATTSSPTCASTASRVELAGDGNGPIAALVHALATSLGIAISVLDYHEHALGRGEDATAAAYVEADVDGEVVWGVGIHASIVTASLRAVVNAVNRGLLLRDERAAALERFSLSDCGSSRIS